MKTHFLSFFLRLIPLLILLFPNQLLSQRQIVPKKAFFFFMKVYDLDLGDKTYKYPNQASRCGSNYLSYYANVFDSYNYKQARNDEFALNSYAKGLNQIVRSGIEAVDFNEIFALPTNAQIGQYSFSKQSFPIKINLKKRIRIYSDDCFLKIKIEYAVNSNSFDWELKMAEEQAKAFIQGRKDSRGNVDRKIFLRLKYSILDKKGDPPSIGSGNAIGRNFIIYIHSIDVFGDNRYSKKIASLEPEIDYYDKVHGIKIKDGQVISYFDSNWNSVGDKENAFYYTIINYSNGKITGPVKSYLISTDKLYFEGNFGDYYAEKGYENGKCIWYYPNGLKNFEIDYKNGKIHGEYKSWFINGQSKEEGTYVDGLKNGCYYSWTEKGKCISGSYSNSKYAPYYRNGNQDSQSRECLCKAATFQEKDSKTLDNKPGQTVSDVDGNIYKTVKIGSQTWMAENLKVDHYQNGDLIAKIESPEEWYSLSSGAFCIYNNDLENKKVYGSLYNWYVVQDTRNVCPIGWHVPSEDDWRTLIKFLGGEMKAIKLMKEIGNTHWKYSDSGVNNSSGFTGLPGGCRTKSGKYHEITLLGYFWSTTPKDINNSFRFCLGSSYSFPFLQNDNRNGFSVRCLKD